jgi:hypothetical protein
LRQGCGDSGLLRRRYTILPGNLRKHQHRSIPS